VQSDKLIAALFDAVESVKKAWAYCPNCRKKVQVDFPDHSARIKAIELLLEQGFGRVGTGAASPAPEVLGGEMTLERLHSMSMPALAALVWSLSSEEQRAAELQLIESLDSEVFPAGFTAALERVHELACDYEGAV
jgi:hypothetical protein